MESRSIEIGWARLQQKEGGSIEYVDMCMMNVDVHPTRQRYMDGWMNGRMDGVCE